MWLCVTYSSAHCTATMSSGEAAMLWKPPSSNSPTKPPNPEPIPLPTPPSSPCTSDSPPHISMINVAAYLQACWLPGSQSFQLSLLKEGIFANSVAKSDAPDLSNIPEEYHEFADVFRQGKVETLPASSIWPQNQSGRRCRTSFWMHVLTHSIRIGPSEHLLKTMLGLVLSDPQILLMQCLFSLSRNRMAVYDFVLTIVGLTRSARRIVILFPSFLISSIPCGKPTHLQKLTFITLTTFCTWYGSFEWLVMPFGLTDAPAALQWFMNDISVTYCKGNLMIDDVLSVALWLRANQTKM